MNDSRLPTSGRRYTRSFGFSRETSIQYGDVFISHQSNDRPAAEKVALTLGRMGYPCYLGIFDPSVAGNDPYLESYLRQVIGRCRALMAIVSPATRSSWWVPLEIGVALEKEKHIATFLLTEVDLPSYLWLWPMLRDDQDAVSWANDLGKYSVTQINHYWRARTRLQKRSYAG
ncbi:MAG: toll/interleukin-1 receptor domain-containing protein [Chloroflexi bacterium]|nr:toll/interleukin-1 receptor domain-containing protein [Chloroflexota bacterium]MYE40794.1 toll/interleukin-1 receptor domain-containing protein [Chloroflexota bacterium]